MYILIASNDVAGGRGGSMQARFSCQSLDELLEVLRKLIEADEQDEEDEPRFTEYRVVVED